MMAWNTRCVRRCQETGGDPGRQTFLRNWHLNEVPRGQAGGGAEKNVSGIQKEGYLPGLHRLWVGTEHSMFKRKTAWLGHRR